MEDAFPPFLQILAMPYAFVVPKEAIDKYGKEFRKNPVGTGPFYMESWDEGDSLVLKKNKNYWKKDHDHQALPYLEGIQISFISDKNQELLAFKEGKLHFISGVDDSTIDQILKKDGTIREDIAKNYKIQKIPQLHTEYLGFQLNPQNYKNRKHPILNVKVRQALSFATNREELVTSRLKNLGDDWLEY